MAGHPPSLSGPLFQATSPSPAIPTVKMVCEMLLGDAEVLKGLLVASFEGALPGPAVEQWARGVAAPLPQGRTPERAEVAVLLRRQRHGSAAAQPGAALPAHPPAGTLAGNTSILTSREASSRSSL